MKLTPEGVVFSFLFFSTQDWATTALQPQLQLHMAAAAANAPTQMCFNANMQMQTCQCKCDDAAFQAKKILQESSSQQENVHCPSLSCCLEHPSC